ncbi:MAG: hypothetical protein A2X66_07085 [Ignavibacteria bacterium GWA2_54_16]|nr:MAG: hypothetical protein A2X66_07085 [Ignavibacteria bacterium GWA2_54_16]
MQETRGAGFHPELRSEKIEQEFLKGTRDKDDGYSAFEATNLDLELYLKEKGVTEIFVTGLATDYCVKASALDAAARGFKVFVVRDAVAAVNVDPADGDRALTEMVKAGVTIVTSVDV